MRDDVDYRNVQARTFDTKSGAKRTGRTRGFTCCQEPHLGNPGSTASTRIDLVLTRTPAVKARAARLVGTSARTAKGLWRRTTSA